MNYNNPFINPYGMAPQYQPPAGMMALWEYLHKKHMEEAMQIKVKQSIYKE